MDIPSTPPALPTAGFIRRLLAIVYDSLLLLGIAFAYGVVITAVRIALVGNDELRYVDLPLALHIAIWLVLWMILAGYYVWCWVKRGQTLGMKSWRLLLQSRDGGPVTPRQAWLRCLLAPVSALPFALGYLWSWFDRRNGCWHDRWTDTLVVVLPKHK